MTPPFFSSQRILREALLPADALVIALLAIACSTESSGALDAKSLAMGPLVDAAVIDARVGLLPDPLLLVAALPILFSPPPHSTVLGSAVVLVLAHVAFLAGQLGGGDVKLLAVVSLTARHPVDLLGVLATAALGAAAYAALGRADIRRRLSFGPWITAATWMVCVLPGGP